MQKRNKTAKKNCRRGGGETRFRKFLNKLQKNTSRTSKTDLLYNTFRVDQSKGPSQGIQLRMSPFTPKFRSKSKSRSRSK